MVASPTLNCGIPMRNHAVAIGATDKDILLAIKNLGQRLQQPRHRPLLIPAERRKSRGSDLGGDKHGGLGPLAAAVGERHRGRQVPEPAMLVAAEITATTFAAFSG